MPIVCVDVFCGVRGAGFQMDKAGRELRDRRRRLRRSGGVLVRFLGNVRDLSERSELSPRWISKSRTSARFP